MSTGPSVAVPAKLSEAEAAKDIASLLVKHRDAIDVLRDLVADDIPKGAHDGVALAYDDIFFLRYISQAPVLK